MAVSLSVPRSLLRTARGIARGQKVTLSQFMTERIRQYLQSVARSMDAFERMAPEEQENILARAKKGRGK